MRLRIPRLMWLSPVLLLAIAAAAIYVMAWLPYLRMQQTVAAVRAAHGECEVIETASPTLISWRDWLIKKVATGPKLAGFRDFLEGCTLRISDLMVVEPVDDAWLARICCVDKIDHLVLGGEKITTAGLKQLGPLPSIEAVTLSSPIEDNALSILRSSSRLKEACLYTSRITNAGLANVRYWPELERLDLPASQVNDDGLKLLQGSRLRVLDLSESQITGPGLAALADIASLEVLEVGGPLLRLLPPGLPPNLTSLSVRGTPYAIDLAPVASLKSLEELDLSRTQIGDDQLKPLVDLPALHSINLCHTQITVKGLRVLSESRNLRSVILNHDQISEADQKEWIASRRLRFVMFDEDNGP